MPSPADPMCRVDDCGWTNAPYDDPGDCSVQAAEGKTRAQAKRDYEYTLDHGWTGVQAWKRSVRVLTRQDAWDDWGLEAEADRLTGDWTFDSPSYDRFVAHCEALPKRVPDNWDPGYAVERNPCWQFSAPGAPGAVEVWVVGEVENGPPPNLRWRNGEIVDLSALTPRAEAPR